MRRMSESAKQPCLATLASVSSLICVLWCALGENRNSWRMAARQMGTAIHTYFIVEWQLTFDVFNIPKTRQCTVLHIFSSTICHSLEMNNLTSSLSLHSARQSRPPRTYGSYSTAVISLQSIYAPRGGHFPEPVRFERIHNPYANPSSVPQYLRLEARSRTFRASGEARVSLFWKSRETEKAPKSLH